MSEPSKIEYEGGQVPAEELGIEKSPLVLRKIRSQGRIFLLNQPLEIEVSRFEGGWCYESTPLAILAFGKTKQQALHSFTEDFLVLWDAIAEAPDESLTKDAVAVKRAFQQLVSAAATE
jgi:hypothetical protein